ncbi:putative CC-NBS-LRR resistance protein, partial [Trifolium pratense]
MLLETLKIRNCDELRHIIVDVGDHNTGGNNWVNVFPKLKKLSVKDCAQLEYIFGPGAETNDHHHHMVVELHFPELTQL